MIGFRSVTTAGGRHAHPPAGINQRSACRHPGWTGPDDLAIKILELREITDWRKPIYVKVGATRTYYDVKLAVAAGADVMVVDGLRGPRRHAGRARRRLRHRTRRLQGHRRAEAAGRHVRPGERARLAGPRAHPDGHRVGDRPGRLSLVLGRP